MVEHDLAKVGVASSSLVSRSKYRSAEIHWILKINKIDASASFFVLLTSIEIHRYLD